MPSVEYAADPAGWSSVSSSARGSAELRAAGHVDEVEMYCKRLIVRNGWCAVWVVASLALFGCSKKDEAATAPRNSQIVARVGDQTISVQELDTELRWNNVASDKKRDDAAVKRVLAGLVARKYLVQQALAARLDREPTVLLDILRSRELVLARAYATRELTKRVSAISGADTEKYIVDHPLRFAQRKLLTVDQVSFATGSIDQAAIESMAQLSSIDNVEQRLTELGIAHVRSSATLVTSELPDDLLNAIQNKNPGEVAFVRSGQNGLFLSIKKEELRPLKSAAAVMLARQLQAKELGRAQAALTNFTANSEAKYQGEYAKIMSDQSASPNVLN